jgi:hypothetical protein
MIPRSLSLVLVCFLAACGGPDPEIQQSIKEWSEKERDMKEELALAKQELRLQESRINETKLREFTELEVKTKAALDEVRITRETIRKEVETTRRELEEGKP